MTGAEIVEKTKELNLPIGSYIIFGSCPMALAGIRESSDIDMLVSLDLIQIFKESGWKEVVKSPDDKPLVFEDFEAHASWNFSAYTPTLEHLLASATVIDGVPFASLQEVKKWKTASARPKDQIDIELIDEYLLIDKI